MKRFILTVMAAMVMAYFGCAPDLQVKNEYPKKVNLGKYKVIKLGWIAYPEGSWSAYGFPSQGKWMKLINELNTKSLPEYLSGFLRGRKVLAARSKSNAIPGGGDLFIKFTYKGIKRGYKTATGGFDYLIVGVEFYDIRTKRRLYGAVVSAHSGRPFPHNWKATAFDGRLDNEVYNLARFIAGKF